MDPNVTLENIRQLATMVEHHGREDDARELAEHVQALDAWLSSGGFLPGAWAR